MKSNYKIWADPYTSELSSTDDESSSLRRLSLTAFYTQNSIMFGQELSLSLRFRFSHPVPFLHTSAFDVSKARPSVSRTLIFSEFPAVAPENFKPGASSSSPLSSSSFSSSSSRSASSSPCSHSSSLFRAASEADAPILRHSHHARVFLIRSSCQYLSLPPTTGIKSLDCRLQKGDGCEHWKD